MAGDLQGEGEGAVLVEVGCVGLSCVSRTTPCRIDPFLAHQVEDTGGVLLLVGMLDKVEETLASLAGPRSDGVGDLGLLAAQVLLQVRGWDRLLAEPKVLLGEAESAAIIC